jgi:hypothetical protein
MNSSAKLPKDNSLSGFELSVLCTYSLNYFARSANKNVFSSHMRAYTKPTINNHQQQYEFVCSVCNY